MEYLSIQASTLLPETSFTFNLFIFINQKFILYIREGDDISEARLNKLKDQAVDRVFIKRNEFPLYNEFITRELIQAENDESMGVEKKVDIVENASINAVSVMEEVIKDPESEEAYQMTVKAAKGLRKVVNENPDALKRILNKKGRGHPLVMEHCKNVGALVCRLGFLLKLPGDEVDQLGTAALIHDMGLTKFKKDELDLIFKKDPKKFTPDEKRIYALHPQDGVDLLKNKKFVNPAILKLIESHEKRTGQMEKGNKVLLSKAEEILALCNLYDKKVTVLKMKPIEAYNEIFSTELGNFDLEFLKYFKKALKAEGIIE